MYIEYSKPSLDLAVEQNGRVRDESELSAKQRLAVQHLIRYPRRESCVLCESSIGAVSAFEQHGFDALQCPECGHIQTANRPPVNYPGCLGDVYRFSAVYPDLADQDYNGRRQRIYDPKRDWIMRSLKSAGLDPEAFKKRKWLEIGCGAGYFVSSMQEWGCGDIKGLEADDGLSKQAREHCGEQFICLSQDGVSRVIAENTADVYVAWFVIEHAEHLPHLWRVFSEKPTGTVLCFSVPLYGFSCLLERLAPSLYARNFDGVIHTHLFTEQSVGYAMKQAQCKVLAEWQFGQDAEDLLRLTLGRSPISFTTKAGHVLQDALQTALDRSGLADQRHFIAIRT